MGVSEDESAEPLTPDQRQFLEQRRREVVRDLDDLQTRRSGPVYEDLHEKYQDLCDELSEIDRQLLGPAG